MSRIIKLDGAGKVRQRLCREVVLALRALVQQPEPNAAARDQAAFISLALEQIAQTVEDSVAAWEKRGYWVKADRFRMDWAWTRNRSRDLRQALLAEDWPRVAITAVEIGDRLKAIKLPRHHRLGTPWDGAWAKLSAEQPS